MEWWPVFEAAAAWAMSPLEVAAWAMPPLEVAAAPPLEVVVPAVLGALFLVRPVHATPQRGR